MRSLLLAAVLVYASAQFPAFRPNGYVDRHDGYSFEFHIHHNTFVVRSHQKCYIMDVADDQHDKLMHRDERYKIEDQMLDMIQKGQNLQKENHIDLLTKHRDAVAAAECRHHELYLLDFFPHAGGN